LSGVQTQFNNMIKFTISKYENIKDHIYEKTNIYYI
jgi:hypothetical protein